MRKVRPLANNAFHFTKHRQDSAWFVQCFCKDASLLFFNLYHFTIRLLSLSPAQRCLGTPLKMIIRTFLALLAASALASTSSFGLSAVDPRNVSTLSKRWDGSPAIGQEYAKAKNKGCTLWSMMHMDDKKAGELFMPPRPSAHSDYLQSDGMKYSSSSISN